jgi:hypothetical protein
VLDLVAVLISKGDLNYFKTYRVLRNRCGGSASSAAETLHSRMDTSPLPVKAQKLAYVTYSTQIHKDSMII